MENKLWSFIDVLLHGVLMRKSTIHGHLRKAFALFALEKADGIGHSHEFVLRVFIRIFSQSPIPLLFSCGIIYTCTPRQYAPMGILADVINTSATEPDMDFCYHVI